VTDLSETGYHALWIPTNVGACENDYRLGGDTIPNQIREPTNDCSANVAMHNLINKGQPRQLFDYSGDL